MLYGKTNKQLLKEFDEHVYGHAEAKKTLISMINRTKIRHRQKHIDLVDKGQVIKPSKVLLMGGSGTGKTYLVERLRAMVDFPLVKVDATRFNPTGAGGGIKSHDLEKKITDVATEYAFLGAETYHSIAGCLDQVVVFVDEFDKLSSHYDGSSGGGWNTHTQTNFLTLIDNKELFAGVSWIFAGAFSGLKTSTSNNSNTIGFHKTAEQIADDTITDEAIIKYGLLPEIVGRLTAIIKLDKLTEDDYYNIITNTLLPIKKKEMLYFDIDNFNIDDNTLREIAAAAKGSSQGVRFAIRELERYFLNAEFNYEGF